MSSKPKTREGPDPKFRARRIEVRRSEGRKRLKRLGGLAAVSAVVVGGILLSDSSLMDVDEIRVMGAERADAGQIRAATGISIGDPLTSLNLANAELEVEGVAWVLDGKVDRSWTGTVTVEVTEREPVMAVASDSGLVLIDASGRQLEAVAEQPPGLLPIAGVTASGVVGTPAPVEAQSAIRVIEAMDEQMKSEVAQILVDDRQLYLELSRGGRVRLGDAAGLEEKLVSTRTIIDQVDLRCLFEIDVRVPSAPAVTRIDSEGIEGASLTDLSTCS